MLAWLDFGWRLLGTGFCFLAFGIGGAIMGLVLFPLVMLLPGTTAARSRRVQRIIRAGFRLFLGTVRFLGIGDISVVNGHLLSCEGRKLVLANHPTLLDVVVVMSLMPQADCVVKQALWRNPFLGRVVRGAGYVSNSSPEKVLEGCHRLLEKDRALVLFPEGTRSVPGQALAFQRGAARLVLRSGAPVQPVTVTCEPATLMKHTKWYRIPPHRWHIRVMAHQPVSRNELLAAQDIPEPAAVRRMTTALQDLFERKLVEHENAYQRIA
ncbi:MAG: 1-acyl-sn-glycerol-3-phosphate acyltransferase [Proteobacteria bacterium]|nr:1-acyl-sn-glycerol-3-phosphate acyltransferase [Pseudomonadota bacterium]